MSAISYPIPQNNRKNAYKWGIGRRASWFIKHHVFALVQVAYDKIPALGATFTKDKLCLQ